WDIYQNQKFLGGAPANFSIHCQQLGNQGVVVSRIGNDQLGEEIRHWLRQRNISDSFLQTDHNKNTGTVYVTLDSASQPSFTITEDVAWDYLELNSQLKQLTTKLDAVLFGTLAQRHPASRHAIQQFLRSADTAFKIYDINLRGWTSETENIVRQSLELADALKLNEDELKLVKQKWEFDGDDNKFLNHLISEFRLKLVALTLGADGCWLINKDHMVNAPGIKIKPVDTTGCGDGFTAALVNHYLQGRSLQEIAHFSNLVGAYVALFPGATPSYGLIDLKNFKKTLSN
ncbi:MAG: carbohydrate kinase, partial [bacterium]|nr:carbohydrate kinase [bacterium]